MAGLVDVLRELVGQYLPEEIEHFEILLVDLAAFWTAGDAVRRVLRRTWSLIPAAIREHGWTISTVSYRAMEDGACTAEERDQVIDFCQRWTRGAEKPHRLT